METVCYPVDSVTPTKSCQSRGSSLRVHFKNTMKTSQATKGLHIQKAIQGEKGVTLKKPRVPFWWYNGGVCRCIQAKRWGWTKSQWPKKER